MPDGIQKFVSIQINGRARQVPDGISVAVALELADEPRREQKARNPVILRSEQNALERRNAGNDHLLR